MTFQELMQKYMPFIERAANGEPQALEEVLKKELAGHLPEEHINVGARLTANDLVSRYRIPEGSGASFEGDMSGSGNDNPDIEVGADQPAPEPVKIHIYYPIPKEKP